jgi:predicted membrane-bound dolichyl-phosphate-mannose-protein mannosyltransferase
VCKEYNSDKTKNVVIGVGIAVMIIVINTILKILTIGLITWVGEDTQSEKLSSITNGVFAAQFFNTGFVLLLVNANLKEHNIKVLDGPYYDYVPDWYG